MPGLLLQRSRPHRAAAADSFRGRTGDDGPAPTHVVFKDDPGGGGCDANGNCGSGGQYNGPGGGPGGQGCVPGVGCGSGGQNAGPGGVPGGTGCLPGVGCGSGHVITLRSRPLSLPAAW